MRAVFLLPHGGEGDPARIRPLFVAAGVRVLAEFLAEEAGADPPHVAVSDPAQTEPLAAGGADEQVGPQAALDEGDVVGARPVLQGQRRLVLADGQGQRLQTLPGHEGGVDIDIVGGAVAAVEHDFVAPVLHDPALDPEPGPAEVGAVIELQPVGVLVVGADVPVRAPGDGHGEVAVRRREGGGGALHLHRRAVGAARGFGCGDGGGVRRVGVRPDLRFELAPQKHEFLLEFVDPFREVLLRRRRRRRGRHESGCRNRSGGVAKHSGVHTSLPFTAWAAA